MKIERISLQNIKSFKEEVVVDFNKQLNIFVGANSSGKSNLLETISLTLAYHFFNPWSFSPETGKLQNIKERLGNISEILDKHFDSKKSDQKIKIYFRVTASDISNLKDIQKQIAALIDFEKSHFGSTNLGILEKSLSNIEEWEGEIFRYEIINNKVKVFDSRADNLLKCLNYYELVYILTEQYNSISSDKKPFICSAPLFSLFNSNRSSHLFGGGFELKSLKVDDRKQLFLKMVASKLGYEDLKIVWKEGGVKIFLYRNNGKISLENASVGEREILGILLQIFELNISGGVVLLDEPELHLYPSRQRTMLDSLNGIASLCDLQFIIMSHSPWMIDKSTITNTFRVFKEDDSTRIYAPSDEFLSTASAKDLVQIVNVLNSEKIFFSDKVILVEGIGDRIIFESLLRKLQVEITSSEEVQIVEVFGKGNLKKFRDFLMKWKIKSYIIADEDYSNDLLKEYDEKVQKDKLIERLREENIFILTKGELEDYFYERHFDIERAIDVADQLESGNRKFPKEFRDTIIKIIKD